MLIPKFPEPAHQWNFSCQFGMSSFPLCMYLQAVSSTRLLNRGFSCLCSALTCCANVSCACFSSGFLEQTFPRVYFLFLYWRFFLYKQQIALLLSFRFKRGFDKKKGGGSPTAQMPAFLCKLLGEKMSNLILPCCLSHRCHYLWI